MDQPTSRFERDSLRRLACIGFIGHAPGLRLFSRCRFSPELTRRNLWALGITLLAMAAAYATGETVSAAGSGWIWLAAAWVVGHFVWSTMLARAILSGDGVVPRPRGPGDARE